MNRGKSALGHDLRRAADVLQHGLMNRGKSARPRANLETLPAEGLVKDGPLRREHNVALAQLLLHLANEAALNLLHRLPSAEWNEDHSCLAALLDVDLLHRRNEDVTHVVLQLRRAAGLKVEKSLRDLLLELVRGRPLLLHNFLARVE